MGSLTFWLLLLAFTGDGPCFGTYADCPITNAGFGGKGHAYLHIEGALLPGQTIHLEPRLLPPQAQFFTVFVSGESSLHDYSQFGLWMGVDQSLVLPLEGGGDFWIPYAVAGQTFYLQGAYYDPAAQRFASTALSRIVVGEVDAFQEFDPGPPHTRLAVKRMADKNAVNLAFPTGNERELLELGLRFNPGDAIREVSPGVPGILVENRHDLDHPPLQQVATLRKDAQGNVLDAKVSLLTGMGDFVEGDWLRARPESTLPDQGSSLATQTRLDDRTILVFQAGTLDAAIEGGSRNSLFRSLKRNGEFALRPGDPNYLQMPGLTGDMILDAHPVLIENGPAKATARVRARCDALDGGVDHVVDFYVSMARDREDLEIRTVLWAGAPGRNEHLVFPQDIVFLIQPTWLAGESTFDLTVAASATDGYPDGRTDTRTLRSSQGDQAAYIQSLTTPTYWSSEHYHRGAWNANYHPWVASHVDPDDDEWRIYDTVGTGLFLNGSGSFGSEHNYPASSFFTIGRRGNGRQISLQVKNGREAFPVGYSFQAANRTLRFHLAPPEVRNPGQQIGLTYGRRKSWDLSLNLTRSRTPAQLWDAAYRIGHPLTARPADLDFLNRRQHATKYLDQGQWNRFFAILGASYPGMQQNYAHNSVFEDRSWRPREWRKQGDTEHERFLMTGWIPDLQTARNRSRYLVDKYCFAIPEGNGFRIPGNEPEDLPFVDSGSRLSHGFHAGYLRQLSELAPLTGDSYYYLGLDMAQQDLLAYDHALTSRLIYYYFHKNTFDVIESALATLEAKNHAALEQIVRQRLVEILTAEYPEDGCLGWLAPIGTPPGTRQNFHGAFAMGSDSSPLDVRALARMLWAGWNFAGQRGEGGLKAGIELRAEDLRTFIRHHLPHDGRYGTNELEYYNIKLWASGQCEDNPTGGQNAYRLGFYQPPVAWTPYNARMYHVLGNVGLEGIHDPIHSYFTDEMTLGVGQGYQQQHLGRGEVSHLIWNYLNSIGRLED